MRANKRGIALVSMLILIVFALALVGAFFRVESGANSILQGGSRHSARLQDLKTLYEFCKYQLETDRQWGLPGGPSANGSWPGVLNWNFVATPPPEGQFDGELAGSGNRFYIHVLNNLDTNNVGPDGIPGRMVRVRIFVQDSGHRSGAEVYLHKAPIYDSSLLASEKILIESAIDIDSVDPIHNKVRAIQGFEFPNFTLVAPQSIDFRGGTSLPSTPNEATGTVWSKQGIDLNGTSLVDAENATGGRFVDFAPQDYVPELLNFTDFKSDTVALPAARFEFGVTELEYFDGATWQPITSGGSPMQFGYMSEQYPIAAPGATTVNFNADALPTHISGNPIRKVPGGEPALERPIMFPLNSGININLDAAQVVIAPTKQIDLTGDFEISGVGGIMPLVSFGNVPGPNGYWTAADSGVLTVDGNLTIEGTIIGQGSVVANGTVTIYPQSVQLGTDTDTELAIFAQQNVIFHSSQLPTPPVAGPTTSLTGLVYAGRDIIFEGAQDDLKIEGALIAPAGNIQILNINKTHLVYNPNYLDVVTSKPGDTKVDLEPVSWRDL